MRHTLSFALKATGEQGIVEGWATSYGNYISKYNMVHKKGMFAKSLQYRLPKGKIKFCWNHDENVLLGTILELREEDKGLFVRAQLSIGGKVPIADEKWELVKSGAINTFSVWYEPLNKVPHILEGHGTVDLITEARLYEVSLVSFEGDENAEVTNFLSGAESANFEQNMAHATYREIRYVIEDALRTTLDELWEKWGEDSTFDIVAGADAALSSYHAEYLKVIADVVAGIVTPPGEEGMEPSELGAFGDLKAQEIAASTTLTLKQAASLVRGVWPTGVSKATLLAALPGRSAEVIALRQQTFNTLCMMLQGNMEPAEITRLTALMNPPATHATQARQEDEAVLEAVRKLNNKIKGDE